MAKGLLGEFVKGLGASGAVEAFMTTLTGCMTCATPAAMMGVIGTGGVLAAPFASLLLLGGVLDWSKGKREKAELDARFREVHAALERIREAQQSDSDWRGLVDELLGERIREAERRDPRKDLEALQAQISDHSESVEQGFEHCRVYLSSITKTLDSIQKSVAEIHTKIDQVSIDVHATAIQSVRARDLGEENLALNNQMIEMIQELLTKHQNDVAPTPVDPTKEQDLEGVFRIALKKIQGGDLDIAELIAAGDVEGVSESFQSDLEHDWDLCDAAFTSINEYRIERAQQASALALAVEDLAGAERWSRRVLGIAPDNPVALNRLGLIAVQREDWIRAESWFSQLAQSKNTEWWLSIAWSNWGAAQGQQADTAEGLARSELLKEACKKYEKATKVDPGHAQAWSNWGVANRMQADAAEGVVRTEMLEEAYKKHEQAIKSDPGCAGAWSNWGVVLWKQSDAAEGEARSELLKESCKMYEQATKADPGYAGAWFNWGSTLWRQGDEAEGEARAELLNEACKKYEQATKAEPGDAQAWSNWGTVKGLQADAAEGVARSELLKEACMKYEQAIRVDPGRAEAWSNWGTAKGQQADAAEGEVRARLREEQIEKYEQATKVDPGDAKVWFNWGTAKGLQADAAEGEARARLRREEIEKYEQATKADPGYANAWSNWGVALSRQAVISQGDERTQLFDEARSKYEIAFSIDRTDTTVLFNMACLEAVQGNATASVEWLGRWVRLESGAIRSDISEDQDFDPVRGESVFVAFMDRHFPI